MSHFVQAIDQCHNLAGVEQPLLHCSVGVFELAPMFTRTRFDARLDFVFPMDECEAHHVIE